MLAAPLKANSHCGSGDSRGPWKERVVTLIAPSALPESTESGTAASRVLPFAALMTSTLRAIRNGAQIRRCRKRSGLIGSRGRHHEKEKSTKREPG